MHRYTNQQAQKGRVLRWYLNECLTCQNKEDILIEYQVGSYYRQFTLAEVIDQNKIDASLDNGVLRLTLPKIEKGKPRQIAVKSG